MLSRTFYGAAAMAAAIGFNAQANAQGSIYTQLGVGVNLKSSVETPTFSYDDGVDSFDAYFRGESDPRITGSLEIGGDRIGGRMRFGVAYDYANFGFDTVRMIGTFNGEPFNESVDLEDFDLEELDLVTGVHLITGQAAVNVMPVNAPVRVLVGGGAGAGFAEGVDTGLALTGTAAVEFPMGRGFAGGIRYRYARVSGWNDDYYAVQYEPASAHLISLTVMVNSGPY